MNTKNILISIGLRHNNKTQDAIFKGFAYIDSGFLSGEIEGSQLSESELTLLTAFTLTGCPIAARCAQPDLNPWMHTQGQYKSHRRLEGETYAAECELTSVSSGGEISMSLDLIVSGKMPDLRSVYRPFQEEIKERKTGHLAGRFDMDFVDFNGNIHQTIATTDYFLDIAFHSRPAWRNITIIGNYGVDSFRQIEQIDLFHDAHAAAADLLSKRSVSAEKLA